MKRLLGWLVASFVLMLLGSYMWAHREHMVTAVAVPAQPAVTQGTPVERNYEEAQESQRAVTLAGPLADYMSRQKPADIETLQPIHPAQPVLNKASASDHVGGSVVGTSQDLLHQTFGVAKAVRLAFQVPAHASTPQLRGTYQSFVKHAGALSSGAEADVEFMVLNEQQYQDFLSGRTGEATFSADDAHQQEVNTSLPPTLDQPVQYYLIFRNNSHAAGKKLVQADFHIDF